MLRELGLKWVVSQLFNTLNYCSFDEPELEQVTPDLFLVFKEEADSITCQSNLSDAPDLYIQSCPVY